MANVIKYNTTTNLFTYSQDISTASWSKVRATITGTTLATTAPDGTYTAQKLIEDTTTGATHFTAKSSTISNTGTTYTVSIYAKAAERTWFAIQTTGEDPNYITAYFDLTNGVLGSVATGITAAISNVGNGWYRCSITRLKQGTISSTIGGAFCISPTNLGFSYNGDGTSGIYLWGGQLEVGSVATTYIPTTTTSTSGSNPLINAIKSGNFAIGVNQGGYGLTSATNYWNGKTPNVSGYTIYVANGVSSPTLYVAANDSELITYSNQLGGSNNVTIGDALTYFNSLSATTCVNVDYPNIVTSGLTLNLDAGFTPSYPKTGTTWTDISGSGNTGTLINGPVYSGDSGGCIVFDGVNNYVIVNGTILQNSGGTINTWTKVITNADNKFIVDAINSLGSNRFYIRQNSPGNFSLVRGANNPITIPTYTLGLWYNITMTWDTSTFYAYTNGTLISSLSYTGGTNPTTIYIGSADGSTNFYNGNISQVSIYNRALSSTEVLQNYYAGLQRFIPTNGLLLYLDGNNTDKQVMTASTANDISGNNTNGTLLNDVALSRDGQRSFLFDGSNDYIDLTSYTNIASSTTNLTVSVWFKMSASQIGTNYLIKFGGTSGGWGLAVSTSVLFSILYTAAGNFLTAGASISSNVWHNMTMTFNGTTFTIYFDGSQIYTSSAYPGSIIDGGSSVVNIGRNGAAGNGYFKGNISTVKVYNQTLTATQVLTIYTAGKGRYGL